MSLLFQRYFLSCFPFKLRGIIDGIYRRVASLAGSSAEGSGAFNINGKYVCANQMSLPRRAQSFLYHQVISSSLKGTFKDYLPLYLIMCFLRATPGQFCLAAEDRCHLICSC
jgi:hypothetical protein